MSKYSFILLLTSSLYSSQFSVNPSFQGFTGLINTPNAQVTKEGHAVLHINNQFDNNLKSYQDNVKDSSQEDYILGFGLFSFVEVQGRLSEAPGYHRDLSVNTKLQLPYHHKYLPDIAIGVQDLGGAANSYDNKYIVMDKELWLVRVSIGYGISSTEYKGKERMDGLFGGVEVKAMEWLYLLAEDDAKEQHLGLRLEAPKSWLSAFNIRGTVVQNITTDETSFALTLDVPLWHESKIQKDVYQKRLQNDSEVIETITTVEMEAEEERKIVPQKIVYTKDKKSIVKQLVDFGFENVRVGNKDGTLYLEAENSIFDHTDLDALGYIAGVISCSDVTYTHYAITLLKNKLKTITMRGVSQDFKNYLDDPSLLNETTLVHNLQFSRDFDDADIIYSKLENSSLFIPRVELSLGLITAVGTEVGVFDYAASLKTNTYMNLYDGLVISAMYELPLAHSNDFDKDGAFYPAFETQLHSRFVNIMLHQTLHIDNLINTVSVGKYETDYLGVMTQANYTTTSGEHSFNYKGGYFVEEQDRSKDRYFSLSSYRYTYAPLDASIEITYGKYWYSDVGTEVVLKRFFGETSIAGTLKSTSSDGIKEHFAGIELSFPLTTRKLFKANYVQIKGKKDFTYKLRTTVNKDDGTNTINHAYGRTPQSDFEVTTTYLNRDRLSASYIKQHIDRLRDAYLTFHTKPSVSQLK